MTKREGSIRSNKEMDAPQHRHGPYTTVVGHCSNNLRTTIILGIVLSYSLSFGQVKETEIYKAAYNYLDSIRNLEFGNAKILSADCKQTVQKSNVKFKDKLQVASKFIENDWGFPLCDLLKKKYTMTENCVYALGSGKCELTRHVQDSLEVFWKDYKMKSKSVIEESLTGIASKRKDGFLVFFSDIYKNTLAAEVKSFCLPYDKTSWQGSSTSFFFVFDNKGVIKEVYSGISIHYD